MTVARAIPRNPETRLAIVYAPAVARPALETLFALDDRLAEIAAAAREPVLGELRLIWWRDALAALDRGAPPAEPLLRQVAAELLTGGIGGAELAPIAEGWAAVIDREAIDEHALAEHLSARGGTIFAVAARLLTGTPAADVGRAGETWALADLAPRLADAQAVAAQTAKDRRGGERPPWPRELRAIGMLAMLARRDLARAVPERRGSPSRIARMMAHRLTGR